MCHLLSIMLSMHHRSKCPSEVSTIMGVVKESNESRPLIAMTESILTPRGTELLLLNQSEIDALYDLLEVVVSVLDELKIEYIVVAGSLLGAVRSESILFNDDGIDIAVIDDADAYNRLTLALPDALARQAEERSAGRARIILKYQTVCDRIESTTSPSVWINLFVLRKYETSEDLVRMVKQSSDGELEVEACLKRIRESISGAVFPLFHFDNPKAVQLWPREYFTQRELRPLRSMPFGPLTVSGPSDRIGPLKRFFGSDCFTHYVVAPRSSVERPHSLWEGSRRVPLSGMQYRPVQHSRREMPSEHSWKALEYTLAMYNEEREPVNVTPPSSGGLGGMNRTRSLFAFDQPVQSIPTLISRTLNNGIELSLNSNGPALEPQPTKRFGHDVRHHIGDNPEAPVFDKELRGIMEPYIAEARREREKFRNPTAASFDPSIASAAGVPYTALREERRFLFDLHSHPLPGILAETLGVEDLCQLHNHPSKDKKELLAPLLTREGRRQFHECYDHFVTSFCIPLLHSLAMTNHEFHSKSNTAASDVKYRYQAFPCLHVIRPGELSIDPHCDTAYGHSIGNLNFHIPLTPVFGTNALYTESHPGREDWHGLTTKSPGIGFLFDGGRCLHFTLENTTNITRVSIDFRIAIYRDSVDNGGLCSHELLADRFSSSGPGYYNETSIADGVSTSSLPGNRLANNRRTTLLDPDARVGFPFT